jgi:hypothetical protein
MQAFLSIKFEQNLKRDDIIIREEITRGIILKQSNHFFQQRLSFDFEVIHILITFSGMHGLLKFGVFL